MPKVTPSLAHFMIDALRSTGLDLDRLCLVAGLDVHALNFDESWVARDKLYRLYSLAAEASNDPNVGLLATSQVGPGIFDVVGYLMMSSATLRIALQHLVHFVALLDTSVTLSLQAQGEQHRFAAHFLGSQKMPRPFSDAVTTLIVRLCRMLTSPELKIRGLGVMHSIPADVSAYTQMFHCPMEFDATCYFILLDNADLEKPLASANKQLAPLHKMIAETSLSARRSIAIPDAVQKMLLASLSTGTPRLEDLAKKMSVSKRTLQRLLRKAGQSYKELVNETRRSQTEFLLGNSQCSLQEAAYHVGFRELSSFYRACHQWYGMTPGQYRMQLKTVGAH
jgi:AraC-like DNA-binding protein